MSPLSFREGHEVVDGMRRGWASWWNARPTHRNGPSLGMSPGATTGMNYEGRTGWGELDR